MNPTAQRNPHGIVTSINNEWRDLFAHGGASMLSRQKVWTAREPAIALIPITENVEHDYQQLEQLDPDSAYEFLRALLRLAQGADTRAAERLAGRTLLQLMLARLVALAKRLRAPGVSTEERHQDVIGAAFWDAIDYCSSDWGGDPGHNLVLSTLKRFKKMQGGEVKEEPVIEPKLSGEPLWHQGQPEPDLGDISCDSQLPEVLAWGVRESVIDLRDAQLLHAGYVTAPERGMSIEQIATELGIKPAYMRQRCHRAKLALNAAAAASARPQESAIGDSLSA